MRAPTQALDLPGAAAEPADDGLASGAIGRGTATGKVILIGEHAVVYGHPAIALPVTSLVAEATAEQTEGPSSLHSPLYSGPLARSPERLQPTAVAITATLAALGASDVGARVRVHSTIPSERGVGSSAAVAAAIVQAVAGMRGVTLSTDERHDLIQTAERAAHGAPSGLDARAVVARGPLWFEHGTATDLRVARPLHLVVADTGVKGRTRQTVGAVRARRADDADAVDADLAAIGSLVADARAALALGDSAALGATLTGAHRFLARLGVSDPALDRLVTAAMNAGALGAKLTGGGGGGCVLALAPDADAALTIAAHLRRAGAAAVWTTGMDARP